MTQVTASAPDEELMQRYQQGDIQAFDELYRRHSPRASAYLRQRLPSRQEADEVLQACFLKLHQSRHQYQAPASFSPWLWSVIRSTLIDRLRSERRNPARTLDSEERTRETLESLPAAKTTGSDSTLDLLRQLESELDAEQRELLQLRFAEGFSFEQIATRIGLTPASARQRVSRLIRRLRGLPKVED